jgi:hypothetical protein
MNRTKKGTLLAVYGCMLLWCAGVEADIYRWVDEEGKVHFGDRPGAAESAEEVRVKGGGGADLPAPGATDRSQTRQRLLEQYEKERLERRAAAAEKKAEQARRTRNCAIAKDRLSTYEKSVLYDYGSDGERQFLSKAEHEQALVDARADVERWCD